MGFGLKGYGLGYVSFKESSSYVYPAYGEGLEVLKEIKTFDQKIPVILNSAYTTFKGDFSTWLADAYVIKSSDFSELKQQIKELLHLN